VSAGIPQIHTRALSVDSSVTALVYGEYSNVNQFFWGHVSTQFLFDLAEAIFSWANVSGRRYIPTPGPQGLILRAALENKAAVYV
jgi:hypothetical protein